MPRQANAATSMSKPGKAEKWAARGERLSMALRENLKKRKQQARDRERARDHAAAGPVPEAPPEAENPDFRRNRGGN
ncbi:MAG: hypothetical protein WA652_14945 [Xanthobacteraceae bacterium]